MAPDLPPGDDFLVPVDLLAEPAKSADEQHEILNLVADVGRPATVHTLECTDWQAGTYDKQANKVYAQTLPLSSLPNELQLALPALLPQGYGPLALRGDSFALHFAVRVPLGREAEALRGSGSYSDGSMTVRAVGVAGGWLVLQFVAWQDQSEPPPPPDDPAWALANPQQWLGREVTCRFPWYMDANNVADLHATPVDFDCGQSLKVKVLANGPLSGPITYRNLAGGLTVRVRLTAFRDDQFWGELNWPIE